MLQNIISTKKITLLLFFFIIGTFSFAQGGKQEETLHQRVMANQQLMRTDSEKAFANIENLMQDAVTNGDKEAELVLLANTCRYFQINGNIKELILAAENLYVQALASNDLNKQAVAKRYLGEAYQQSELYDEAIVELNNALSILENEDPNDENTINSKANIYISLANTYVKIEAHVKSIENLKLAEKEHKKLDPSQKKQYLFYLNYSNLAIVYATENIDSSYHYVRKSIAKKPNTAQDDDVMVRNYMTLAIISKEKKKYEEAIGHLTKAENLTYELGGMSNLLTLYTTFIEVFQAIGDTDSEKEYRNKLKEVELEIAQSKNKSLHKIIEKQKKKQNQTDKNRQTKIIIWSSIAIPFLLLFFYIYRRNLHSKYEKLSEEYLRKNAVPAKVNTDLYNEIIELIKNNDPGLMIFFNKAYPDFSNKLFAITPNLIQSEVEFCTLLKLNLSTKEIAQYKFIQPRTVQNKKYHIRKKLNIPDSIDIYQWFNNL